MQTIGTMAEFRPDLGSGKPTLDLCAGCADELGKWLEIKTAETATPMA
jgi:hypothetical protein